MSSFLDQLSATVLGPSRPLPVSAGGPPFGASGHRNCDQPLSLFFFETALSRRKRTVRLPKGANYPSYLVMKMIERDAAVGFDIQVPDGANFVEVSMPSSVMRTYQQARQAHPNAANLPPMRIVERNTVPHTIALLQGGVIYVKEEAKQS